MAVVNLSFDFPFSAFLTDLGGMGLMMGGIFTEFAMKYRCVFEVKVHFLSTGAFV